MMLMRCGLWVGVLMLLGAAVAAAAEAQAPKTATFEAHDTLDIPPDPNTRAQAVLDGLAWTPESFEVTAVAASPDYDAVVWFPSPRPSGQAAQDRVPMFWFAAREDLPADEAVGEAIQAPAVLLVHSLHPRMPFAQMVARELAKSGTHAFVIHLPGYGLREDVGSGRGTGVTALLHMRQAVADIRRARDAIAALPNIKPGPVGLIGISLGGFAAASAGAIDQAFSPVIIVLSGVNAMLVLRKGHADAETVRQSLARAGYEGQALRDLMARADPMYLAHRLDPATTWLFSAKADQVIPLASTAALVEAVGLDPSHHIWVPGDHYTAVFSLPGIVKRIERILGDRPGR